ncbi:Potassium transporter [Vermiconidia calcicola]|uniref:Potassium transporter n=1 Tax=Vermiconidia calcicola TaxID=1690605 RepID=A0ACC3MF34_9PEZI|nr:Potassium transporter [Vermiconidia calcicola]
MGCFGDRERGPPEQKQKWEFINLQDFKNTSFWTPLAYAWFWFMGLVGVAVYAVDTFTAVQLLAFNNWSSQVQPWLDFKYTKWIFAVCICLSWALLIYEIPRALRVIKRGGVAASYMDPIARWLQCAKPRGWQRFLVFTELTKSAIRIILCEGPRQVVNGMTLATLFEDKLLNQEGNKDKSEFEQFFINLQGLANENTQQAVILGSMLFTLVIWVFSALCLIAAGILYLVFLWHYIPQRDGRLRIYCRRKIDRRLEKIVEAKVHAGIEEENRLREKAERRAELKRQKTGELTPPAPPRIARKPTLPQLGQSPELKKEDEKFASMGLNRQETNTTISTLPVYSSRPPTRQGTQRQPTLPDFGTATETPAMPLRSATHGSEWSQTSFNSNAPLLSNAGYAGGDGRSGSPTPTYYSRQTSNASSFNRRPLPGHNMSQSTDAPSQRSFTSMSRIDTNGSQRPPPGQRFPVRSNTSFSFDQEPQSAISPTTMPVDAYGRPMMPPIRPGTADTFRPTGSSRNDSDASYFNTSVAGRPDPGMDRRPTHGSFHSQQSFSRPMPRNTSQASSSHRPFTPASEQEQLPRSNSYEMTSQSSYGSWSAGAQRQGSDGGYVAFNPGMHGTSNTPAPQPYGQPFRSATAPNGNRVISSILDDYGAFGHEDHDAIGRVSPPAGPPRAHTASPYEGGWQNRF